MTPREVRNSDLHPPLAGPLADNLAELVREGFGEAAIVTCGQHDIDDALVEVVFDRVVIAEGHALADTAIKQPVDVGDDDLFELTGLDQLGSSGWTLGRHAGV